MREIWKPAAVLLACTVGLAGCGDSEPGRKSSTRTSETQPKDDEEQRGLFAPLAAKPVRKPKDHPSRQMHFECIKCEHAFSLGAKELKKAVPDMMGEMGMLHVACPKCKARKAALPATKCPKCEKHFLSAGMKQHAEMLAGMEAAAKAGRKYQRPTQPVAKTVCGHCGTDIAQWYRQKYRRKKR